MNKPRIIHHLLPYNLTKTIHHTPCRVCTTMESLRLLAEGHNARWQHYMYVQKENIHSFNLLDTFASIAANVIPKVPKAIQDGDLVV